MELTASETVTRQTFMGMYKWEILGFYCLAGVSTAIFFFGLYRLTMRYTKNRKTAVVPRKKIHILRAAKAVFSHAWISRNSSKSGYAHAGVFYGFLVLLIGTTILAIEDHITKPLGFSFWYGKFYIGYSLFLDLFGAAMIAGLIYFMIRRATSTSIRLSYKRLDTVPISKKRERYNFDDWVFLWSLLFIGASGFLLEALRIALTMPPFEKWSPVGYSLGYAINKLSPPDSITEIFRHSLWWAHSLASLVFIALIPFTKAVHMITGPSSIATRDEAVSKTLPNSPELGYQTLQDFSVTHRINLDSCTKCGACHDVCPARISGSPLSPRDLILDLREGQSLGLQGSIIPEIIRPDTVWSCLQCNACVEVCPVGIEIVPIINLLRRGMVETGEIENSLKAALTAIQNTGNSFGESARKRARWSRELGFEILDARETEVEFLWFVGDFASLDPRNQINTRALAHLLQKSGVSFGILFEDEQTAGNDVRRAGEEGLFNILAESNIEKLKKCRFKKILTSDPHSFNTLRNEYPKLGAPWRKEDVIHHSELLLELLKSEKLLVKNPINVEATYHDPCALGRYNGIFDQPRELIEICGISIKEMPRNRLNSFCCGGGGGRIWMKEIPGTGTRRPSEMRIDEAVSLGKIKYFIVACPKDVVMYEDAIKTSGREGEIELKEISQLVLAAVSDESENLQPMEVVSQ